MLTRAAILLFGRDRCVRGLLPRPVLDYQRIDTRFDTWSADERWHDRVVFEENLFKTWRGLVAKYSRIAEHPFKVDPATMRRTDDPPDYIAFREAVINLLIHQDYGDHHRKASLKWFTDRIQLWNPGDAFATQAQLLESNEKEIRYPLIVRIPPYRLERPGRDRHPRHFAQLARAGPAPPEINNDKGDKSFELILRQEPLITQRMQRFQASLGVNLSAEQADVLALAGERESLPVIDAAMVTGGNLKMAYGALSHLNRQCLLDALDGDRHSLAPPIRARLERIAGADEGETEAPRRDQESLEGTKSGPS